MSTSVRTKTSKKQPPTLVVPAKEDKDIEQAMLALESACVRIFEGKFTSGKQDIDGLMWQRKFRNIATPVSLALAECKGPRRFHYHYKHREDDASVLQPVQDNPLDILAHVCEVALLNSQTQLVGIQDDKIVRYRSMLESALSAFLAQYE